MYLMFKYKGMMPSVFYKIKHGEKRITKAFMYQEMDEKIEEIKNFGGGL
ncbi:hypothetical protein [Clostridioides sp. ES-S-0010-02]|nr:hypothetical protein JJC01_10620 [Clostridioides sp. ES-S-0010-02]